MYTIINGNKVGVELYVNGLSDSYNVLVLELINMKHLMYSIKDVDTLSSQTLLIDYADDDVLSYILMCNEKGILKVDFEKDVMKLLRKEKINRALV